MAYIAFDMGNTIAKAGLFQDSSLSETRKFNQDAYQEMLNFVNDHQPDQVIIGSVITIPDDFLTALQNKTQVLTLGNHLALPIKLGYQKPEELGKDRIASVASVACMFPGENALSIDLGSCITYDYVNKHKVFEGGSISPGFQMRLKAMHHFTDQLPNIAGTELAPVSLLAKSTRDGMLSGVIHGILKEIDGIIDAYKKVDHHIRIIIGGGDAPFFENNLKNAIFAEPELVLKGLNQIRQFNAE